MICRSLPSVNIPVSVTSIEENVFRDCNSLKNVYYSGTKAQGGQVKIENLYKGNDSLYNATIHYNAAPSPSTSKKYMVTFNPNSGTTTTKSKSVTNGSTYGTLPAPTRTGYKFDGWYTAKTVGTKVTAATKATSVKTLYAHWTMADLTAKPPQNVSRQIVISEDYPVLLYSNEMTASVAKTAAAQASKYMITCTKRVELSNGTVRYYAKLPKVSSSASYWFTYSDEMFINYQISKLRRDKMSFRSFKIG